MTDNIEILVFERLKAIQAEQSAARERDGELLRRIAHLEIKIAQIGLDQAQTYNAIELDKAEKIFDSIDRDLKWLIEVFERRLELKEN